MDVQRSRPDWWANPLACRNGHDRRPGTITVCWLPCLRGARHNRPSPGDLQGDRLRLASLAQAPPRRRRGGHRPAQRLIPAQQPHNRPGSTISAWRQSLTVTGLCAYYLPPIPATRILANVAAYALFSPQVPFRVSTVTEKSG